MFDLAEVLTLLEVKLRGASKYLISARRERLVRISGYAVVLGIFFAGGYIFFYRIFAYLYTVELLGSILIGRILSMAFLVFLSMLFMSNIVTSLSTLYRSSEVEFLMSLPVASDSVFALKFVENLTYSSWATLIAGLPIILSFGAASKSPFHFYPLSIAAFLLFAVIPAGFGVTILMMLTRFFPRVGKREIVLFLIGLFVLGALLFLLVARPERITELPSTVDLHELDDYLESLGAISSPLLPSTWLSNLLLSTANRSGANVFFYLLVLLVTAVFSTSLAMGVASRTYRMAWVTSRESGGKRQGARIRARSSERLILKVFGQQLRALIDKDLKLFFRDATQWSQAAILLGLLSVYVLSLRRTPIYFTAPFWRNLVSLINLGFTGYVFATISIRFVFPSISLEGQAIWVVRSAPLSIRNLFFGKLVLNLVLGILIVEGIILASDLLLKVDAIVTAISMVAVLIFSCALVSISIGFGASMPDLKESNPSKIASGPGGILAALTSLAYVGLSITILAWPSYVYLSSRLVGSPLKTFPFFASGLAFLILSGVATAVPLFLGMRSLAVREI
jgi:ABC-2 type transport system permease protein